MTKQLLQPENTEIVWDRVSQDYDEQRYWAGLENQANLQELVSHIGDPNGKQIIEVGCGSGYSSLALARRGAKIALLDISEQALKCATDAFERTGMPVPLCFKADALENTVPSDSFDVAWNGGVIEHFYDSGKERLLQEMSVLRSPEAK